MLLHSQTALFALIQLTFVPKCMAWALSPLSEKYNDSNPLRATDRRAFFLAFQWLAESRSIARHSSDSLRVFERANTDQRTDIGNARTRLRRKRSARPQMILIASWSGIVGSQKAG